MLLSAGVVQGIAKSHAFLGVLVVGAIYVLSSITSAPSMFGTSRFRYPASEDGRPLENFTHSRTLAVAERIYVMGLKRATERRETMEKLAEALDLDFTYVDATDAKEEAWGKTIQRILDRVRWQRARLDEREADPSKGEIPVADENSSSQWDFHVFPFAWSSEVEFMLASTPDNLLNPEPLEIRGADYWDLSPPDEKWENAHPMPELTQKWKDSAAGRVKSASVRNNLHKWEFMTKGGMGCLHSHVRILKDIVNRRLSSAIVLEDDIDLEWGIEKTLLSQWPGLPSTWDIVYLGHCWSADEKNQPSLPSSPFLHKTSHALCTHAYAVSLKGASKILRFFRSPDYAYSRPADHMLKDLVQQHLLESYTFVPPVVVQTKSTASEINPGSGAVNSAWKNVSGEALVDSTLERIQGRQQLRGIKDQ